MRFSAVGSSELVGSIVDHIDGKIAAGELVPGQRLVEADLSSELGVGRMPIREALRILAGDGVVELSPYKGAKLRKMEAFQLFEMLETQTGLFDLAALLFIRRGRNPVSINDLKLALQQILDAARTQSASLILSRIFNYNATIARHAANSHLIDVMRRCHRGHYSVQFLELVGLAPLLANAGSYPHLTEKLIEGDIHAVRDVIVGNLEELMMQFNKR